MSQREFYGWLDYLNDKGPDVQELQLAVLSNMVASGLGSKKSKVSDFIITKQRQQISSTGVMDEKTVRSTFSALARRG